MFANVGWSEMLVLLVIGLVVLGPERLPGAIRWTAGALRQAREYLGNATSSLREDLGPEFDDLREPLNQLNSLRGMTPRAAITKHLLDGDESIFGSLDSAKGSIADVRNEFSAAGADLAGPTGVPRPGGPGSDGTGPDPASGGDPDATATTKFDPDAT